ATPAAVTTATRRSCATTAATNAPASTHPATAAGGRLAGRAAAGRPSDSGRPVLVGREDLAAGPARELNPPGIPGRPIGLVLE
ncbi:MAG: hypothetical protein QOE92_761, partial [Chloroflexota bacterium]|nr:hypothetical protein [Chloroflexota bacterium]